MERQPAAPLRVASSQGRWVLLATILSSGMSFLDSTVVNVALPTLQTDFDAKLSSVAWVVDAYVLTLTAFILLGGSFGDLHGRRRALRLGLGVFTVGSMLCGLAPTLLVLDLARGLQGMGGALLVPSSLAILTASFDPSERGRAVGLWASLSGVGAAIGPLAGGLLVDAVSWRGIFFLNLPVAAVVLLVALPKIPESDGAATDRHLDIPGASVAVVWLAGLTFAMIQGSSLGWMAPAVVAGFAIGAIGFATFLVVERRVPHPMVSLGIFGNRTFSGVNVATLTIYFALSGAALFLVLDLQQVRGFSALAAGASLLPLTGLLLVGSPYAGRLADRVGPRLPMTIGPILAGVGLAIAAVTANVPSYFASVLPAVIVFAVGLALTVAPLTTAVLSALGPRQAGLASGVNSAISRFGGLVAVAVLPALSLAAFSHALEQRLDDAPLAPSVRAQVFDERADQGALTPPDGLADADRAIVRVAVRRSFAEGFRVVMAVCAALLFAGGAISFAVLSKGNGRGDPGGPAPYNGAGPPRSVHGAGFAKSLTVCKPYVCAVSAVTTNEFVSFAAEKSSSTA